MLPCFNNEVRIPGTGERAVVNQWIVSYNYSPESQDLGFTVIIDTRGSSYNAIKPILKTLEEGKIPMLKVHHVYLTKPDTFWQKKRTSLAKGKYKYEVM